MTLVCPVYNEAENVGRLFNSIRANVAVPWELMLVYDADDDDTLPPARAIAAEHSLPMALVKNEYGAGALGAVKTGLARAKGPAVAVIMGDCSDDLPALNAMYEMFRAGCDVVCGSRYMKGGGQIGGPWLKSALSRFAGISLHALTGIPTHDLTNNFKLYSRAFLDTVSVESNAGFEIASELVVKAYAYGFRIGEVPVTWVERTAGTSRFKLFRWLPQYLRWYAFACAAALRRSLRRRNRHV
jgi:dolichol-phosphate mannosyltransferase